MNYQCSCLSEKTQFGLAGLKYPIGLVGSFKLAGSCKLAGFPMGLLSQSILLSKVSWLDPELGENFSPSFLDKYESDRIMKKEIVADANIIVTRYKNVNNPVVSGYVEKSKSEKENIKKNRENSFFIALTSTSAWSSISNSVLNPLSNYLKWLNICQFSLETYYV